MSLIKTVFKKVDFLNIVAVWYDDHQRASPAYYEMTAALRNNDLRSQASRTKRATCDKDLLT